MVLLAQAAVRRAARLRPLVPVPREAVAAPTTQWAQVLEDLAADLMPAVQDRAHLVKDILVPMAAVLVEPVVAVVEHQSLAYQWLDTTAAMAAMAASGSTAQLMLAVVDHHMQVAVKVAEVLAEVTAPLACQAQVEPTPEAVVVQEDHQAVYLVVQVARAW